MPQCAVPPVVPPPSPITPRPSVLWWTWLQHSTVQEGCGALHHLHPAAAPNRFPPAGGFGMNTGLQDTHNLAWKLAAVLHGSATAQLLHSYKAERRPVAAANTALSVANWLEALRVPAALGLDARAANVLHAALSLPVLPRAAGAAVLDAALATGRGLAAAISPLREHSLRSILQSGRSLRLQFPREDLGFTYPVIHPGTDSGSNAAAAAAAADVTDNSSSSSGSSGSNSSSSSRDSPYVPSTAPGGRLPHVPLLLFTGRGRRSEQEV